MLNDELLHKWINNTITEKELAVFKQREEYDSLVELYEKTDGISAPKFDAEDMLSNILKTPKEENLVVPLSKPKANKGIPLWLKFGIAASFLFAASLLFLPKNDLVRLEMAANENQNGSLPDGSTFILQENSQLKYRSKGWAENRVLELDGEAFFGVKEGSTFEVKTKLGKVTVLGTQFLVVARDDLFQVKCRRGQVRVTSKDGKYNEVITASESVQFSQDGNFETKKSNLTSLKDVPFSTVVDNLERQFGITISSSNIEMGKMISCNFQHANLEMALKTATAPLDIKYKIVNDQLVEFSK